MKIRPYRYFRYQYLKLLRLKDSPNKVASGVALGVALDFLPLPLVSLIVAYVIARLAGFNRVAAVGTTALFKWAVPGFFMLDILTGKALLGQWTKVPGGIANRPDPLYGENIFQVLELIKHYGTPFLLGSVVNALVAGLLVFFPIRKLLQVYQQRRRRKVFSK